MFCKSSFSRNPKLFSKNQKCGGPGCRTCPVMTLPKTITVEGVMIRLDFSLNCKSDNVIYMGKCKTCNTTVQCYFGQTCNALRMRFNGHQSCFKTKNLSYVKSALSMHVHNEHLDKFVDKLHNFEFGIIKQVKPMALDRAEDFYIWKTNSDIVGLNRHKVIK